MKWADVLADKSLSDLPYKIELNEKGKIEMSPASNRHGKLQARIIQHLNALMKSGEAFPECSIATSQNVKVADAVWQSDAHFSTHGDATPYAVAPEIVVEIVSPSNSSYEITTKKQLYFAAGAIEVWICNDAGELSFYNANGQIDRSNLCPDFPLNVGKRSA